MWMKSKYDIESDYNFYGVSADMVFY